jgi:hypothetical protein
LSDPWDFRIFSCRIAAFLFIFCCMGVSYMASAAQISVAPALAVQVVLDPHSSREAMARYAARELQDHLGKIANVEATLGAVSHDGPIVRMRVAPDAFRGSAAEGFKIQTRGDHLVELIGYDAAGLLWAVRDFQHYYCDGWVDALRKGTSQEINVTSAPTIQNRGLWTWLRGCYEPYAYIDRASEWKLNTVIFWNEFVPMNADLLTAYAHERGVRIWWGFSWGWSVGDFKNARPEIAQRLTALYEKQKKKWGDHLQTLDLSDPETAPALKDLVLDIYERQYAWIPEIDGIYFQSATEAVNPAYPNKGPELGDAFVRNIVPIMEELHRRYPKLKISAGIHNTGTKETYRALQQAPAWCNIMWEAGATWAPSREIALDQMKYRGAEEDFAGIYRITMNACMEYRGELIRGEKDHVWLPRQEVLWDYLENGQPEGSAAGFKILKVGDKEVGCPCTSDWRRGKGRLVDNANYREFLTWARDMAGGPAKSKGIILLIEAGLIDLKMRRVPAMLAEALWNPLVEEKDLEHRSRLIWEKEVGGWSEPLLPFWNEKATTQTQEGPKPAAVEDLGEVYRQMGKTGDERQKANP